jgi:predicted AAA+ superfamily ATPase
VAVSLFGENYERFILLNLEKPGDARLFRQGLDVKDLFQAILLHQREPHQKGRTLLFLDEIQSCPEAIATLRHFYEELPEVHVIAAGSLLEIMLARMSVSFPVGRVQQLTMYPLSFSEFLTATGATDALAAMGQVPLPGFAHQILMDLFHRYALVGGMPEIVAGYCRDEDIASLGPTYEALLQSYLDDVPKYARSESLKQVLSHCIEAAPLAAGTRITFAGFGRSNYRSREVGESLRTLEKAMLIHLIHPTTSTRLPIRPDLRKSPRLLLLDTGLLNFFGGLQGQHFQHADLHGFYRGLIAEHIVGQELICAGASALRKPCFWVREKSQSQAEVDYVVRYGSDIIPVEVKAGKAGRLRSLHEFVDLSGQRVAVRLYAGPLKKEVCTTTRGREFELLSVPYFLASKIADYLDAFPALPASTG